MAKSKKKKVEDFKKVKLKVGKKLKKPTETNTAFKTGKVVLLEQLNRDAIDNEHIPTTKRKLALTDLLRHLRHYNINVRKDGVNGLKELLTENAHLIQSNLSTLIENLGPLLLENDSDIMKTAVVIWERIFSVVDSANLAPHWSLLSAHLNCAMTHLNADVKRHSLDVFNFLLTYHKDLFHRGALSYNLVKCFLDSLPDNSNSSSTRGRSLMSMTSKRHLLKTLKNFISVVVSNEAGDSGESRIGCAPDIDCRQASEGIISVSVPSTEWRRIEFQQCDEYLRPQTALPTEIDQYSEFINAVFPFCHSMWIEVTSAEDQQNVDCFTFDLVTLVTMHDILTVYNTLLRRPVHLIAPDGEYATDANIVTFRNFIGKKLTKSYMDRYQKFLPCRRSPRRAGEAAGLSDYNLNADPCWSVNFGLCRFLAYTAAIIGDSVLYPVEQISDLVSFAREKKIDPETLRCGVELIRDLRFLLSLHRFTSIDPLKSHYSQLGELLMDSVLDQNRKWKIKVDVMTWICKDLEEMVDLDNWPRLAQFIEQSPAIMSSLLDEVNNSSSTKPSSFLSAVLALLHRLTRILLLRADRLPVPTAVAKLVSSNDLISLILANIQRYPPGQRREILNLLYYATPLQEKVAESLVALSSTDSESLLRFLP